MENSKQYQILNNVVTNPNASVDNALNQVSDLTISALAPSYDENLSPGNVDYIISFTLLMLVQRLEPTKHRKLVQFLYGLQKRTVTDPATGQGDNIHLIDRSHRALRILKLALENDDISMPMLARMVAMEAACIWFIYAAARMWDNFRYGRTYDPEDFGTGPGYQLGFYYYYFCPDYGQYR
ncbi:hypothetical protein SI65_08411 [Aspergillus cristatus]|uniref:Uncharacterized protein n=1 Tax=Aspergillus cristatus TaxID=573508 RepID=A0A1E3B4V6_ASPCR|nr:hypothetical protein SI65_08411 [Aspergillus cristatus]